MKPRHHPRTGRPHRCLDRTSVLWGVPVALVVFSLYLSTLAPTVLGFEPPVVFDAAMLQAAAHTLGIAHPTGYSTYLMLTHLFTYLPLGDVAYRVNLASAVFGAAAVFVVYLVGLKLGGRVVAASVGALAFGVSVTFWSQAVIAEVYTLNALFVASILLVLLLWRDSERSGLLMLACFLAGLSFTHHLTSALLIPAGLAFVYLSKPPALSLRRLAPKGLGLFFLGLIPYLYFPIRALMNAPLNEADPSSPGRFLLLVTGGSFVFKDYDEGAESRPEVPAIEAATTRLSDYAGYLSEQFPVLIVAVGLVGLLSLVSRDRAASVLLGVPFLGSLLHGLFYGYEDYFIFLIPAYLVFGLFVCVGTSLVLDAVENILSARRVSFVSGIVCAGLILPVLVGAWANFSSQDRSGDLSGRETIEAVAEYAEPNSTVLHHRSSLWYMVLVEERRTDLTLVDPFRTSFVRHTDIVWPDDLDSEESERLYGTGDSSGVETTRMVSGDGAVYILGRELDAGIVDAGDFREAGFEVVRVDEAGELYELIPADRSQRVRVSAGESPRTDV